MQGTPRRDLIVTKRNGAKIGQYVRCTGKNMRASALFEARVIASDMAIFTFLALSLSFTLAKNKAEAVLGHCIGEVPAQNWSQITSPFWRLMIKTKA